VYNIDCWWPKVWSPKTHLKFPREFRGTVTTMLMLRNRNVIPVPRDVLYLIINLAKQPKDYSRQNSIGIGNLCLHTRCKERKLCRLCGSQMCVTSDEIETNSGCTTAKCQIYEFECYKCKELILRGSNKNDRCTHYRCFKHGRCGTCGQRLKPTAEDEGCGHSEVLYDGRVKDNCQMLIYSTHQLEKNHLDGLIDTMGFDIVGWETRNVLIKWSGLSYDQKRSNLKRFYFDNHSSFTQEQLILMAPYLSVLFDRRIPK